MYYLHALQVLHGKKDFFASLCEKNDFLCSFVCFMDDNRILIYVGGSMKTGYIYHRGRRGRGGKAVVSE